MWKSAHEAQYAPGACLTENLKPRLRKLHWEIRDVLCHLDLPDFRGFSPTMLPLFFAFPKSCPRAYPEHFRGGTMRKT